MHTSHLDQFATRCGRIVTFLKRPPKTRQKNYREPIVVTKKRFERVTDAEIAIRQWQDGQLV